MSRRGSENTTGGDDDCGEGRVCDTGMVGRHGRAEHCGMRGQNQAGTRGIAERGMVIETELQDSTKPLCFQI